MAPYELDVRQLHKSDKHPTIFATHAALSAGESFVLVSNHDPKHLRGVEAASPSATWTPTSSPCLPRA